MSEDNKAVAKVTTKELQEPGLNYPELFKAAMQNEKGLEIIERLTALKNREEDRAREEEARQAELSFNRDYVEMQAQFEPVKKARENKQYNSKYAGIDDLQRQYGPIISKHEFTFDFSDPEFLDDGSVICCFNLRKYGYTRKTKIKMPAYKPEKIMNAMQAVGTQLSYGNRYAMKAGLGVTESDDDTDGNLTFDNGIKYGDMSLQISECKTLAELQEVTQGFYNSLKTADDTEGIEVLRKLKIKRKGEIAK